MGPSKIARAVLLIGVGVAVIVAADQRPIAAR
jgi:hypothetical protein